MILAIDPFGKLLKIWVVIRGNAIFLLFLVCSAELVVLCNASFSHQVKFYSFVFLMYQEFVVCNIAGNCITYAENSTIFYFKSVSTWQEGPTAACTKLIRIYGI